MKYTKLFEHATGETHLVSPGKLAEMKQAQTFNRVFRNDGEASEEDLATHDKRNAEGELEVDAAHIAEPTGQALPAANAAKKDTPAPSGQPAPQTGVNGTEKP